MAPVLLRSALCASCSPRLQRQQPCLHRPWRATGAVPCNRLRVGCAASETDLPSAEPEKFVNLRELLDEVSGTNFVFEDTEEGDVWAFESRLASSPPAQEELQSMPEVKGALSADAVDILTAYSTEQGFQEVTVEALFAQLHPDAEGQDAASSSGVAPALLDVRTRAEYAEGRVPGALNVPMDELSEAVKAGQLDAMRARPLAVICRSGRRSAQATVRLSRVFNFDSAFNVAGGTLAWAAAGYPLETDGK